MRFAVESPFVIMTTD